MPSRGPGFSQSPRVFPNGQRTNNAPLGDVTPTANAAVGVGAWAIVTATETPVNTGDNGDMICLADPEALYELQEFVLTNVTALVNENPHAEKKITNAYIAVGDPVFDCSQITVHAGNVRMAPQYVDPNGQRYCTGEYLVDITVFVLRCYPTTDVKNDLSNRFARILNYDASRMYWGFECYLLSNGIPDSKDCKLYAPGIMNPVTPQSGVGGWTWTWTFSIQSC